MKSSTLKPVVLAIGLALSTLAGAATDSSVFNVRELDTQVSACSNLNAFVNAKWVAAHPIPADKTRWGAFDELAEKSLDIQHEIVQQAAKNATSAKPGSIEQKIGYFYESGMDQAAIDAAGIKPLQPDLDAISRIITQPQLVNYLDASFAKGQGEYSRLAAGDRSLVRYSALAAADRSGYSTAASRRAGGWERV